MGDQIHTSDLYTDGKQLLVYLSTKCSIFFHQRLSKVRRSDRTSPTTWTSTAQGCSTLCLTIFLKVQGEDALNMKSIFDGYIYFWIVENWNEVRFLSFITFLHLRSLFVSYPGSGRSWLRSMFEVNIFSSCTILLRFYQVWVLCFALISRT